MKHRLSARDALNACAFKRHRQKNGIIHSIIRRLCFFVLCSNRQKMKRFAGSNNLKRK